MSHEIWKDKQIKVAFLISSDSTKNRPIILFLDFFSCAAKRIYPALD